MEFAHVREQELEWEQDKTEEEEDQEQQEQQEDQDQTEREEEEETMRPKSLPSRMDRRSSYFKLVESFASELGELEQEMGQLRPAPGGTVDSDGHVLLQGLDGLVGEMSGVYLQQPPQGRLDEQDCGCDSLARHVSLLDRLTTTHPIWLLLSLSDQEVTHILLQQSPGAFLVRRSCKLQRKVLSMRVDGSCGQPICDYPVKENQYTFSLEGSGISFADLFRLVAFYCISRDVLPFTLKLPEVVATAKSQAELEEMAQLGAGFWDSGPHGNRRASSSSSSSSFTSSPPRCLSQGRRLSPRRCGVPVEEESSRSAPAHQESPLAGSLAGAPPPQPHHHHHQHHQHHQPLDKSQSSTAALCFVNPLFLQTHRPTHRPLQPDTWASEGPSSPGEPNSSGKPRAPPPPRPPPPRSWPQRPRASTASVPVQRTMLQTASPFHSSATSTSAPTGHPQSPQRSPPAYMGTSHSKSRGATKKPGLPIPVPRLQPKKKLPDVDSHYCHIALDDETIAKALAQTKLPHHRGPVLSLSPPPLPGGGEGGRGHGHGHSSSPSSPSPSRSPSSSPTRKPVQHHQPPAQSNSGREQRLSCLSFSTTTTSSSSSSASSGGSQGGLSPGHRGLQRSPALRGRAPAEHSSEDDGDEDEEDEEEEEEYDDDNYGVGLEQDLQLRLQAPYRYRGRLALPGRGGPRSLQGPTALHILPRALKGQFRKVSGMLGSLATTPERRAVRRVAELARNKGSYFGCLVQDYVSFMLENGGGAAGGLHTSALDLLQTLRHFITQMKAYLIHSSELQPPIESFIPEDQIDPVLERAMHKCVLKPLKATMETALHDFEVRSGAWQRLRENLALAKTRRPEELGVEGALPPDAAALDKIRHKLHAMGKMYSPEKKVQLLLHVCKLIYSVMQDNSGRMFGADDFLPMLTYVLAQCDMPQLDTDIQYMMELLDPTLLCGEGGYYLTSAYSAMELIKNLQEEQAARVLSSKAQNTLHQWHRRRTTQRSIPTLEDFQNYLRVALQEVGSGCTSKTLQVRPYVTTEEVCQLCALKFRVADPESHALFLLTDGASQQLAPDTHPQRIKAELHSRPQVQDYHFVYRRMSTLGLGQSHDQNHNQNHSLPADNTTSTSTSTSGHCISNGLPNSS
ncbi:ras and Rab interactor 2 isoform X2 [Alosa sapidissima]|uniref:ras and Rab interactor 2 isoform X2 n=1 Tax=Alosa sapidissima TaxID=34773 RepID=UPI001C089C46|nr:ras and Rab interactor 2 isoform X2 [Alosa sapidissima]